MDCIVAWKWGWSAVHTDARVVYLFKSLERAMVSHRWTMLHATTSIPVRLEHIRIRFLLVVFQLDHCASTFNDEVCTYVYIDFVTCTSQYHGKRSHYFSLHPTTNLECVWWICVVRNDSTLCAIFWTSHPMQFCTNEYITRTYTASLYTSY